MQTDLSPRNPALLIAPGTRARLELARDVAADVLRGAEAGPLLWLWVPRAGEDPSLQQALGELRDELDPTSMRGSLGLLIDGPPPPIGRESHVHARLVASLAREAAGVVLLAGPPIGYRAWPHAAADLASARDRRLARDLGLHLVTTPMFQPSLNRNLVPAPACWLIAGESDRFDRAVVDTVREALRTLLIAIGILGGTRALASVAIVRTLSLVEVPTPGLVEAAVELGTSVRQRDALAHVGEPGLMSRRTLRAPHAGVLLYARTGHVLEGAAAVVARLPAGVTPTRASVPNELGWCELVDLPDLGVLGLAAKIDTGARTSALHIQSQRLLERTGRGRAIYEIEVPAGDTGGRSSIKRARVEVIEHAVVRDSGGHAERRPVIETTLRVGGRARRVRVSLTDRGDMRFPMLVGRTALDRQTRIDPTRSFIGRARHSPGSGKDRRKPKP